MQNNYLDSDIDYTKVEDWRILIGLICRFKNRYQTLAEASANELSWNQIFFLKGVSLFNSPPTIQDMANCLGCSHQNANQILHKLIKNGYINISVDKLDHRKQRIKLTETANQFLEEYNKKNDFIENTVFDDMPSEEINNMIKIINKLICNINNAKNF